MPKITNSRRTNYTRPNVPGQRNFKKPGLKTNQGANLQPQYEGISMSSPQTSVATLTNTNLEQHTRSYPNPVKSYPIAGSESSSSTNSSQQGTERRYGIDDRGGQRVSVSTGNINYLFTNPGNKGGITLYGSSNRLFDSRLLINSANFSVTGTTGSIAEDNFKTIYRDYLNKVSMNSNATVTNKFSFKNFKLYVTNVACALDYYYLVDNILAFNTDFETQCPPLRRMSEILNDPDLLETKYNLQMDLKHYWLPANVRSIIRWNNQNFRTSELGNSSVFRYIPSNNSNPFGENWGVNMIARGQSCLDNLAADTDSDTTLTAQTSSLMTAALNKTVSESIIGDLPLSSNTTGYDADATEVFINRNIIIGEQTYPLYEAQTEHIYCTNRNPENITKLAIAMQDFRPGISSSYSGLFVDSASTYNQAGACNKFTASYNPIDDTYSLDNRLDHTTMNTDDVHTFEVSSNDFWSKVPSGHIQLHVNARQGIDKTVREFQNFLFDVKS